MRSAQASGLTRVDDGTAALHAAIIITVVHAREAVERGAVIQAVVAVRRQGTTRHSVQSTPFHVAMWGSVEQWWCTHVKPSNVGQSSRL